jgi:phenylacetate-CoA ligase
LSEAESTDATLQRANDLANPADRLELLLESEAWPPKRREQWRRRQLQVVLDAARGSEFWAERLSSGRRPRLRRDELRESFDRIRTGLSGPAVECMSSGSSGQPVRALLGPEQIGFGAAARLRQLHWFGFESERVATANLYGRPDAGHPPLRQLSDSPPAYSINPWALGPGQLPAVHRRMVEAGGARIIGANTSIFTLFADLYERAGLDGRDLGCELAIVGSELTDEVQRARIAEVFGCRVAEMYGAREAPVIATECTEGSLHINEDAYLLEIVTPDGGPAAAGELGRVALTHLHNVEFPLLGYELGDVARMLEGRCACGRTLGRLDLELGHLEEMVLKRDGSLVHPNFIRNAYERAFGMRLRAFHTSQPEPGRLIAHLDIDRVSGDHARAVREGVAGVIGEPIEIELRIDPERAHRRLPNGKLRAFSREC